MCGIAGIVSSPAVSIPLDQVRAMTAAIEHRGPDEVGERLEPGVALGIRRLRIIDLLTGGQPMRNEDGSVWTIHNGEIYNFVVLRDQLAARGHAFRTRSDTEVIVHAYEEWGEECVSRFRGMFALAVWDGRTRTLLLARDRLGKKPLVYATVGERLAFASEIQSLLALHGLSRELDLGALGDYLAYGYVPAPATIFRSIRKLPPGHLLVWRDGALEVRRYWELRYQPKLAIPEDEALAELERRLEEAVRLRLVADVPLGALLSGGVDSSTVVALMARAGGRVKTFSIGFEESAYDELAHARRVAERYDTEHHEFVVRPDAASVLPKLVRHYGEPYADSSAIPTYYVTQLARGHVTVALNGDGGDESFAGYDRYRAMRWADLARSVPGAAAVFPPAGQAIGRTVGRASRGAARAARFIRAAALPPRERYVRWVSFLTADLLDALVPHDVWSAVSAERSRAVERAFDAAGGLDPIDRVLATDVATYLPYDLLVKMDIASMANSLETRSPLLDHELVEFAARLPAEYKLRGGREQKYLLKRLARRLVPGENLHRPKQGFAVPVGSWLRRELRELAQDALLGGRARTRGYFEPAAVRRIWDEHQSRRVDRTSALWTLLMLELWHREVLEAPRAEPSAVA